MLRIVDQKNFYAGVLYLLLGGSVAIVSAGYSIGTTARMGPGYFPVLVGSLLALLGIIVAAGAVSPSARSTRIARVKPWSLFFVLLAVVSFAILLRPAGAGLAIIALTLISALAVEKTNWRQVCLTALVLVPLAYMIFVTIIGLQLRFLPAFLSYLGV